MRKIFILSTVATSMAFSFYKFEPVKFTKMEYSNYKLKFNEFAHDKNPPICPYTNRPYEFKHITSPYLFEDVLLFSDPVAKFYMTTSPKKLNLVHENNSIAFDKSFLKSFNDYLPDRCKLVESSLDKDPIADFLACNFDYDPKIFWDLNNLEQYGSIHSGRCIGPILLGNPYSKDDKNSQSKSFANNEYSESFLPKYWRTRYVTEKELDAINHLSGYRTKFDKKCSKSNWYEEKIKNISTSVEYITYYSKETEEKYPLYLNKQRFTPSEDYNLKNWHLTPIKLRQTISIKDKNIDIVNEDKVTLYKKDENGNIIKQIDLQEALLNYFNPNYFHTRFAQQLKQEQNLDPTFSSLQTSTAAYAINHLNRPHLRRENYALLQNSTILAVWDISTKTVLAEENIIMPNGSSWRRYNKPFPSIFVGLARDSEGQLFHWVTDLNADIEILFSLEGPK